MIERSVKPDRSFSEQFIRERRIMRNTFSSVCVKAVVFYLILLPSGVSAQQGQLIPNPLRNIPRWVRDTFTGAHLDEKYTIIYERYPTILKGDYNGDGRKDVVLQVKEAGGGKDGIAIFHGRKAQALGTHVVIIGAGNSQNGSPTDLKDFTLWASIPRGKIHSQAVHPPIESVKGDLIQMKTSKGKSSFVYWNGKQYRWSSG